MSRLPLSPSPFPPPQSRVNALFAEFDLLQRRALQLHEPVDVFTDAFFEALLDRLRSLIGMIEATEAPALHPVCFGPTLIRCHVLPLLPFLIDSHNPPPPLSGSRFLSPLSCRPVMTPPSTPR